MMSNIELRPFAKEDAYVLMALNNDSEVAKYVVGNPKKVSYEQQLIWMENTKKETNVVRRMIAVDGKAVGTIFVSSIDYKNETGNVNIKILPEFQGQGIGKISLKKGCDFAFDELHLFCLTANILPYNVASCRLFLGVGFHQDGLLRSRIIKNGERFDLLNFSLLRSERR